MLKAFAYAYSKALDINGIWLAQNARRSSPVDHFTHFKNAVVRRVVPTHALAISSS